MPALAPPVRRGAAAKPTPPVGTRVRPKVPMQAKLKVSSPGDALERQADQSADRVMRAAKPFPMAGPRQEEKPQRKPRDERAHRKTEEARSRVEEKAAQRDVAAGGAGDVAGGDVPTGFEGSVGRARQAGGGRLGGETLQVMERGLGQSFDHVRIYDDGPAGSLASSIDARAFTLGSDVFFGAGEYQPHTQDGRRLIAHELTHVVQQSGGVASASRVYRLPGSAGTTTPVAAGQPSSAGTAAPQPQGPPTFVGRDNRRIVKQPEGNKQGTFYLPALKVPKVAGGFKGISNQTNEVLRGRPAEGKNPLVDGQAFLWTGKTPRGSESARRKWIAAAQADTALQSALAENVRTRFGASGAGGGGGAAPGAGGEDAPAPVAAGDQPTFYLKAARTGGPIFYIVGTAQEVAHHELVTLPTWNKDRTRHEFDVDHLHELQLGGLDGWENFWVLDASANRSSGSLIFSNLKGDVERLIREASDGRFWPGLGGTTPPSFEEISANWQLRFDTFNELALAGNSEVYWTRDEIKNGLHLPGLRAMTENQIVDEGLRLRPGEWPTRLNVFSNATGGYAKGLRRSGETWRANAGEGEFYRGFVVDQILIDQFSSVEQGKPVGKIIGTALGRASKSGKVFPPIPVELPLLQSQRLGFGVWVDREAFRNQIRELRFKQASPVEIEDAGISPVGALFVEGRIITSLPLFSGLEIPFAIVGDQLTVEFPIPTDRLHLGPVSVTEAALEIGVNPDGLELGGAVGFEVRGVGNGRLEAGVSTAGAAAPPAGGGPGGGEASPGFALSGSFDFDSDKLDPARIGVAYGNHQFTVDALVGLRQGAVRGLRSAEIHVQRGEDGIRVEGTAELGIPGLQGTRLTVNRGEAGDIMIGADDIPLPVSRIPGVSSATASIHVVNDAASGEWHVSGGGSAAIGIGGVTGTLRVDVVDSFLTITGDNIQIHRGPLEGGGNFVVTNRPRDESGRPLEEGDPTNLTASGHLEASLPLGPYLRGTIGGTILPNGELEFTGGLALPPVIDLFEQRRFDRELFRPPSLDIPILGISAAGQRIGIFATIGGSLNFGASVGPGQLRDTALVATFNPDHPENTTVHGTATFVVPAEAGLRLEIHGGIGAGIPIVSAEAGIEIGGSLGIAAEASAAVTVDWTPASGLAVEAVAHLQAQPQFTFDISAYLRIVADVVITEFELYSERWTLSSFTFGPQMSLGVDLPVRWTELGGLDFDLNRIQIQRPDIDFSQLGGDLIHHLVG